MSFSEWKYAFSSVIGTSHVKSGKPCQDSSICDVIQQDNGIPALVAVVSDGAGSAKYSDIGSSLACSLFINEIETFFAKGNKVENLSKKWSLHWLEKFQAQISTKAKEASCSSREFSCTLLVAVITDDAAAFIQIGDGAIIIANESEPDIYNWVFWPMNGEYENTTFFATEKQASERLEFDLHIGRIYELAIISDGLQRLALHYQTQSVHNPFFLTFFFALRELNKGTSKKYTKALSDFLNSNQVNERTDDDKSLILATRRSVPSVMND
jgi:hypothetical protein